MIRGVLLISVGIGLGYGLGFAKAVSENEEVANAARLFQNFLVDLEEEHQREAARNRAAAQKEPEEKDTEPENIQDAVTVPDDQDKEGETP